MYISFLRWSQFLASKNSQEDAVARVVPSFSSLEVQAMEVGEIFQESDQRGRGVFREIASAERERF